VGQQVYQHTLPNGLVLLAERMDHVRSAAFNFLVPAGAAYDPPDRPGLASMLADVITRGAGDRDSRELDLALSGLGVDGSENPALMNIQFWGTTLSRNVPAALDIYADILRRPHLPDDELEPAQLAALSELALLEDSPPQKAGVELNARYYPAPLNRYPGGTEAGIQATTADDIRGHFTRLFRPNGTILSVAGNIEWGPLKAQVERLFGDWEPRSIAPPTPGPHAPTSAHIAKDTQQTQVVLAYPSVPFSHPDYYAARGAAGVLSAGMSSRLFHEVREVRGLCYAVYARYEAMRDRGTVYAYVASATHQAQEALDVLVRELRRLAEGVADDEVDRVRVKLKSALVMQQESTASRAGAMASDWYYLARVRPLDEILAAVAGLTPAAILDHVARFPTRGLTYLTLGPAPLAFPE